MLHIHTLPATQSTWIFSSSSPFSNSNWSKFGQPSVKPPASVSRQNAPFWILQSMMDSTQLSASDA
jgi:hypothetical protein